jgi:hypothetical protein
MDRTGDNRTGKEAKGDGRRQGSDRVLCMAMAPLVLEGIGAGYEDRAAEYGREGSDARRTIVERSVANVAVGDEAGRSINEYKSDVRCRLRREVSFRARS